MFFLNLLHSVIWFRKKHQSSTDLCRNAHAYVQSLFCCVQMFWLNLRAEQANSPRPGSWAELHLTYWRAMPLCMVPDLWTITQDNLHSSFICLSCVSFLTRRAAENSFISDWKLTLFPSFPSLSHYCPSDKPESILEWTLDYHLGILRSPAVSRVWTQTHMNITSGQLFLWLLPHMLKLGTSLARKPGPAFPCGHVERLRQRKSRQVKAPLTVPCIDESVFCPNLHKS